MIPFGNLAAESLKLLKESQEKLRTEFFELRNEETDNVFQFLEKYRFRGLEELSLANPEFRLLDTQSFNMKAAQTELFFRSRPYDINSWATSLISLLKGGIDRPIDFILGSLHFLSHYYLILSFVMVLCVCLHLFFWRHSILQSLQRPLALKSEVSLQLSFIITLLIPFFFGLASLSIIISCFLLLCFSRQRRTPLFLNLAVIALMTFNTITQDFQTALTTEKLRESLVKGRTELSVSAESLSELNAWEQALWVFYNGDRLKAIQINLNHDNSKPALIVDANLHAQPGLVDQSILTYQKLQSRFPEDPLITFNLSQLYTRKQDLVSAEEMRRKLTDQDYDSLLRLIDRESQSLAMPQPQPSALRAFIKSIQHVGNEPGAHLKNIILVGLSLLSLILGLVIRKKANGICDITGLPTESSSYPYSKVAQAILQKSEKLEPHLRQRYHRLQRAHENERTSLIKFSSFFIPGSFFIIKHQFASGLVLSAFVYLLFWVSLPYSFQFMSLQLVDESSSVRFFNPSFAPSFFILFVITYIVSVAFQFRKANQ